MTRKVKVIRLASIAKILACKNRHCSLSLEDAGLVRYLLHEYSMPDENSFFLHFLSRPVFMRIFPMDHSNTYGCSVATHALYIFKTSRSAAQCHSLYNKRVHRAIALSMMFI